MSSIQVDAMPLANMITPTLTPRQGVAFDAHHNAMQAGTTVVATTPTTEQSSKKRAHQNASRRLWTAEEDDRLRAAIAKYGPYGWAYIATQVGTRMDWQCRERWHNHLRPEVKKGSWTAEEDDLIFKGVQRLGTNWALIQKDLPGRTGHAIKNRFYSRRREFARVTGTDPNTPLHALGGENARKRKRALAAQTASSTDSGDDGTGSAGEAAIDTTAPSGPPPALPPSATMTTTSSDGSDPQGTASRPAKVARRPLAPAIVPTAWPGGAGLPSFPASAAAALAGLGLTPAAMSLLGHTHGLANPFAGLAQLGLMPWSAQPCASTPTDSEDAPSNMSQAVHTPVSAAAPAMHIQNMLTSQLLASLSTLVNSSEGIALPSVPPMQPPHSSTPAPASGAHQSESVTEFLQILTDGCIQAPVSLEGGHEKPVERADTLSLDELSSVLAAPAAAHDESTADSSNALASGSAWLPSGNYSFERDLFLLGGNAH